MKTTRIFAILFCSSLFVIACQKEVSFETGQLPGPLPAPVPAPPIDTVQTSQPTPPPQPEPVEITIKNPGFEDSLYYWRKETTYKGRNGFKVSGAAARSGNLGMSFYASQPHHAGGAKEETPWNGKIVQTVKGLKDGRYRFQIYARAVGNGMYLWADGGGGEAKALIKSDVTELNTLEFDVKGGVAKFGFNCINANGPQPSAPNFQADDAALLKLP
jgi:hypothetical protein